MVLWSSFLVGNPKWACEQGAKRGSFNNSMKLKDETVDVVIIGAGAAGLMCAIEAGKRHRKVLILDRANKPGKKILMSGGGRCNFTNYGISPDRYISHNPHFCKSALKRYTQWDFINLVKQHRIPFHEKTLGQLFCDNKAQDILNLLLDLCEKNGVELRLNTIVESIENKNNNENVNDNSREYLFKVKTNTSILQCKSLVIACGGLSIPTMGASAFGYKVAEQFGIKVWPVRAGLVPFTLQPKDKEWLSPLAGVALDSIVSSPHNSFRENILFTHRGLSGPAILQLSSYWEPGESVIVNMLPDLNLLEYFKKLRLQKVQKHLKLILSELLPKRVVETFLESNILIQKLPEISLSVLEQVANQFQHWEVKPNGTEGYRTAEVTLGGVDCDAISSKTFEAKRVPGLYFIGEVLDVTGWLGGYNFQWAWSSGWAAGQVV